MAGPPALEKLQGVFATRHDTCSASWVVGSYLVSMAMQDLWEDQVAALKASLSSISGGGVGVSTSHHIQLRPLAASAWGGEGSDMRLRQLEADLAAMTRRAEELAAQVGRLQNHSTTPH